MFSGNEFQKMDVATGKEWWPTVDRMMDSAVDVMMTSEVGDDRACQRREPADPRNTAHDHPAHEMPWQPL